MDGERLQQRVYSGYEKAARRVGLSHTIYRPLTSSNPISEPNRLGTIRAVVTSNDFKFSSPESHSEHTTRMLVDGREIEVGDYLVREGDTYFIASMGHIRPIQAVRCNAILTIKRPPMPQSYGLNTYGGDIRPQESVIAANWPGSLAMLGNGKTDEPLPADAGTGRRRIMLPNMGIQVLHSDIIEDAFAMRYTVMSAELTSLGWRIDTMHAVA